MENADSPSRIILDPSVLFTEEALGWMEDPELKPYLVVSEALWQRLGDEEAVGQFSPYAEPEPWQVAAARNAMEINGIARFSYEEAIERGEVPEGAREICQRLVENEEPLADVLADEWAFMTSQSLAVIAERASHALRAFGRAGADVLEVSRAQMEKALASAQQILPPGLLRCMKTVGRFPEPMPKVLAWGGNAALTVFVPQLGIPLVVATGIKEGVRIVAGDP